MKGRVVMMIANRTVRRATVALLLAAVGAARADEGMWLLNEPPQRLLAERHDFRPAEGWYEHLQRSCVRLGRGGSASLVSPRGLVLTNHHVAMGQIRKLSTAERDLLRDGFLAQSFEEELRCADLDAYVLMSIRDVTDEVVAAVTAEMDSAAANAARRRRIAELEAADPERPQRRLEVVTLYRGAVYHLYEFRRYDDLRLVWTPELQAGAFGGDVDNFEYPRYVLDAALLRIYENGKPLELENGRRRDEAAEASVWKPAPRFLRWSRDGCDEGDLVFVIGHPARTQRILTMDHVRFLRDVEYPAVLRRLWRREVQLRTFCERGPENERIARTVLYGVQNGRKAVTGYLAALHDPQGMAARAEQERRLREAVAANPQWQAQWGDAWDQIAAALENYRTFQARHTALEGRRSAFGSQLLSIAQRLVRHAEEREKLDGERLPEHREANLEAFTLRLLSPAPIEAPLEIDALASGLSLLAEEFGADDPLVEKLLDGRAPRPRAVELVRDSSLADVEVRRRLLEGGRAAVEASDDALIRFARLLDPEARALRQRYEDEFESVEREAYAKIAAAQFALHGRELAPDATGSLRVSFGVVRGYEEDGETVPPFTRIGGLFERSAQRGGAPPFDVPQHWAPKREAIDKSVPFNFVSTADVIGGNSGSPVVNRAGEVVGLIFDINLHALGWNTAYIDEPARSIAVDSRAILHLLESVYGAERLVGEITGAEQ